MPIEITIPRLGWSMEEGAFGEWLKRDGEFVKAGEPIFMLESDKAMQEVESIDEGWLHIVPPGLAAGELVKVGQLIGYLLATGETPPAQIRRSPANETPAPTGAAPPTVAGPTAGAGAAASTTRNAGADATRGTTAGTGAGTGAGGAPASPAASRAAAPPSVRRLARELGVDWTSLSLRGTLSKNDVLRAAGVDPGGPSPMRMAGAPPRRKQHPGLPRISPRAARAAAAVGVDWTTLHGTGKGGRIRERDVRAAARPRPSVGAAAGVNVGVNVGGDAGASGALQPASPTRRKIAERMWAGAHEAAPVTLTAKVDASALIAARETRSCETSAGETRAGETVRPSYNDLLLKLAARCLVEHPSLNASWRDGGVFQYAEINIAIAVATDRGLLAPVVKNVNSLTLEEVGRQTRDLTARARAGGLRRSELSGGTFTVTNLGSFGVEFFTPIINLPQAAILGVGRIATEPVVRGDQVVPGAVLPLSLTFDHRVVDGAEAAQWLQQFAKKILDPMPQLEGKQRDQ